MAQASRAFLARVRRFQFSTAPNISRLEAGAKLAETALRALFCAPQALVGLLAKAGHCAVERTHDEVGRALAHAQDIYIYIYIYIFFFIFI